MPAGRPSAYTEAIAEEICERIACGESLLSVCKSNNMPDRMTVNRWQNKDPEFASRIAHARDLGQDFIIDECREIADEADEDNVNVAKLRIWHRQWEASKRAGKRFGDKIQQEVSGKDGGPVQFLIRDVDKE